MRRLFLTAFTLAAALQFSAVPAANAQEGGVVARNVKKAAVHKKPVRSHSQTVVITPRYLTTGTKVSPDEARGANVTADVRFRPTGRNISGYDQVNLRADPYYLPHPQSTVYFDSPLGRKLPGER